MPEGKQDTSHGASADSIGSSDDSGASISTSTGNTDGYLTVGIIMILEILVVIMGRMVPWASLPENADTGADIY